MHHLFNYKNELRKGLSDKVYVDRLQNLLPSLLDELGNDQELRQLLISSAESRLKDTAQQISRHLSNDSPLSNITCAILLLELLLININIYKNAQDDDGVDAILRLPTRISNLSDRLSLAKIPIPSILLPEWVSYPFAASC